MNAILKSKSTRLLSALLAVLMIVAMLPTSAFAWSVEEGTKCTSTYGDKYLGSDGDYFYSKPTTTAIFYNDDGSFYVKTYSSGNAKYKYMMIDGNGNQHHVYCIEGGVSFDYSDTYNSTSGKNSKYFQNLPITAQYGIMMALMYGYHEGMTSPIPGTNNDDFAFATQCIIWEYQQQLRTSPTSIASNNGIDADMYNHTIKGRPAEQCYQNKLDDIKNSNTYDELEMSGSRAVWPEFLSIYAVKTTNDPDNPQKVASMTDEKKQLLKDIFWEMNEISYETEEKTETVIVETDDGEGNIIEEEVEETTVYLYITVSHKTVEEMMAQYGFTEDQKAQVAELLAQDGSMWVSVLYGIYGADDQIVAVALSQLGNVGGEPYWSWHGFGSRVEWCTCFVSWCADQCGYIETGVIPKYAGCVNGVNWFKDRGQWADNDIEPAPGMIIFFDWDNKGSSGPQDGESDHTGIVERVEDGIVYTVEGNSGDSCRENHYAVGYYEILGYGIPAY